jgi:apolipoprotein N-acyltransferase
VVWPESAVPYLIDERADARNAIAAAIGDESLLLMGSLRRARPAGDPMSRPLFYNSLMVLDGRGEVKGSYDKWRLVPFGEYLPLARWLEPLGFRRLVTVPASFDPGPGRLSMDLGRAGVMVPLICYEAIFPGRVTGREGRPDWLLNITNDGWFGTTSGPSQHFAQARFRAIEEGLPLVRAANTGISAVIDPYGRVLDFLPLGAKGSIDSGLPARLETTAYAKVGEGAFLVLLLAGALAGMVRRGSRRATGVVVQN